MVRHLLYTSILCSGSVSQRWPAPRPLRTCLRSECTGVVYLGIGARQEAEARKGSL